MKGVHAANKRYLEKLVRQLDPVVPTLLSEAATYVYREVLNFTAVDSGQALHNWHIIPLKGESLSLPGQRIMWGYGDTLPTAPVGWKSWYSEGRTNPVDETEMVNTLIQFSLDMKDYIFHGDYDKVVVYNPITPGFSGFSPGDDRDYETAALGQVHTWETTIQVAALAHAESVAVSRFKFVVKQ